jgi:hypothetical protein
MNNVHIEPITLQRNVRIDHPVEKTKLTKLKKKKNVLTIKFVSSSTAVFDVYAYVPMVCYAKAESLVSQR